MRKWARRNQTSLIFFGIMAGCLGAIVGLPYYMIHKRDYERADSSCYSLASSYYELHPEMRIMIIKAKSDGILTNGECKEMMDFSRQRDLTKEQREEDEKFKAIGEDLPPPSEDAEVSTLDVKR